MTRRIDIDGQDFDVVERFTLEQELYLAGLIRHARLDRVRISRNSSADDQFFAVADTLERSRVTRRMLAALLVPAGEEWTLREAQKTESYLHEHLPGMDDNLAVNLGIVLFQALDDRGAIAASIEAEERRK